MLYAELDRSERILHFVCDLARHFTPGENPLGPQFIGDVLEGKNDSPGFLPGNFPGPYPDTTLAQLELDRGFAKAFP